jgi:hypothetical protein
VPRALEFEVGAQNSSAADGVGNPSAGDAQSGQRGSNADESEFEVDARNSSSRRSESDGWLGVS